MTGKHGEEIGLLATNRTSGRAEREKLVCLRRKLCWKFHLYQTKLNNDGVGDICCCLNRGDIDHAGGPSPIDIADLVYLVDYMFSGGDEPPCLDEGNVDGSALAPVDISDLVYMVDFMFSGGPPPPGCP